MTTAIADLLELHIVDLINAERDQAGLQPVHVEVHLNGSAQGHSDWMADEQVISHTGENGSTPSDRAQDAEFPLEGGSWKLTENVAYKGVSGAPGEADMDAIHAALMGSESHRDNILDPDVDYVGVGISVGQMGQQDVVFVTQNFAHSSQPVLVQEEVGGQTVLTTYLDGESVPGTSQPVPDDEEEPDSGDGGDDGDQQDGTTASGGSCFVATAAYGDRLHPDVVMLRRFRDQYLVRSPAGRAFIRVYWIVGPHMARVVRADRLTGRLAWLALRPCIAGARIVLDREDGQAGAVVLDTAWRAAS